MKRKIALLLMLLVMPFSIVNAGVIGVTKNSISVKNGASPLAKTIEVMGKGEMFKSDVKDGYFRVNSGYIGTKDVDVKAVTVRTKEVVEVFIDAEMRASTVVPKNSKLFLIGNCGNYYLGIRPNGNQYLVYKDDIESDELKYLKVISLPKTIRYIDYSKFSLKLSSSKQQILLNTGSVKQRDIVNKAVTYVGGKYVWGGTTLGKGVDCSGFVREVYKLFGITLGGNSASLVKYGKAVPKTQLEPGDLVFFCTDKERPGIISHIGIYMQDGKFVHAANSRKGIIISDLSEYAKVYKTARRILQG